MDRKRFNDALRKGHKAERIILVCLRNAGCRADISNDGPEQDIIATVQGYKQRIEVKNEVEQKFVNVCVEMTQGADNHPSGIQTSKSNVFIHLFRNNRICIYDTASMLKFILATRRGATMLFAKSDNNNKGHLMSIAALDGFLAPWFENCLLDDLCGSPVFSIRPDDPPETNNSVAQIQLSLWNK